MIESRESSRSFLVEELEDRYELAAFAAQDESIAADDGCCSCSICMGTDCCDTTIDCPPQAT